MWNRINAMRASTFEENLRRMVTLDRLARSSLFAFTRWGLVWIQRNKL